jgi:hypothetical protein
MFSPLYDVIAGFDPTFTVLGTTGPVRSLVNSKTEAATGWTVRTSNPVKSKGFFSLLKCPPRLWGGHNLLFRGYEDAFAGWKRPGRDVDHSPPSSAEVKNEYSCTPAPVICLHGVGRDFNFQIQTALGAVCGVMECLFCNLAVSMFFYGCCPFFARASILQLTLVVIISSFYPNDAFPSQSN